MRSWILRRAFSILLGTIGSGKSTILKHCLKEEPGNA
jgi:ABC-type cobalamin/Fe3+-siderophores transport system ATPase subunit